MDMKGLTRGGASIAALFMFWLVYALFALQSGTQLPYGIHSIAWIIDPLYAGLRLPAIASVLLVSSALGGIILLDYAVTGELNL